MFILCTYKYFNIVLLYFVINLLCDYFGSVSEYLIYNGNVPNNKVPYA